MGGDHGPSVTLPLASAFLAAHPEAEVILVGRADALAARRPGRAAPSSPPPRSVEMDDPIEVAFDAKDSSMRVAISQVKPDADGRRRQACVSAGNTGALMAVSRYLLKTLEGIDRPAIAA
jgi:glycerol-3-phosphate acyltransferase PlsX